MEIKLYQNKRNPHKYMEVKHTNDHHYMWRQYLQWDNGVRNNTLDRFTRVNKRTREEVLEDYDYVEIERAR